MPSPTLSQVHTPTAMGNGTKKPKPKAKGKGGKKS
jgi:hypothetical protein